MLTFTQAQDLLGVRESKTLENNTKLVRLTVNQFAITLHGNVVVRINRDGSYVLHTGGWRTMTTKDRLCRYSPVGVFQKAGEWFLNLPTPVPFVDGMQVG